MTGFLGFDRRRVAALAAAVADLEGERARLGEDAWEAHGLLAPYRAAVQRVLEWQPRFAAILAAADGEVSHGGEPGYRPVDVSWQLRDAIVLTGGGRWRDVLVDPRRVPARRTTIDARTRARALVTLLSGLDPSSVDGDPALLAAVAAELGHVARSPAAAAWLLAGLGPDRFGALVAVVAGPAAGSPWPGPRRQAADRARVLAALGAILSAVPTGELVDASLAVMRSASTLRSDEEAAARTNPILAALATDGTAARIVLEQLSRDQLTALLVRPRRDPELLAQVLLASNDPAATDATTVARSMQRVLEVLHEHRAHLGSGAWTATFADVPPHLGVYLGRWPEPLASGWGGDRRWSVEHVGWLAARPAVAMELLITLDARYRVHVGLAVASGAVDRVGSLAYAHAAAADLVAHAELGAALADAATWQRSAAQIQFALDAAALALAPVAPALAAGAEGLALAGSAAEAAGVSPSSWLLARLADRPEAVRDVLARQAADRDAGDAELEHVALTAVVQAYAARHPGLRLPALPVPGAVSPTAPRPGSAGNRVGRVYHARVDAWVEELRRQGVPSLQALADQVEDVSADVRTAALDARNHVAA